MCRGLLPDDADTGGKDGVDREIWVERQQTTGGEDLIRQVVLLLHNVNKMEMTQFYHPHQAGAQRTVSCIDTLGCSTWKCLWTKGLGRWWTLKMSFCPSLPSSSTNIMESMRESTADSCVSKRRDN